IVNQSIGVTKVSTNPTNVPTADDVAALQALARGSPQRKGLTTLLIHCGITGQPERVRLGDLFSVVEPWTMDSEVVPVLTTSADRYFVDTFDEERITGTTVWDVLWQDADGQEHRARLTDVTISRLEDHLEEAFQEDW